MVQNPAGGEPVVPQAPRKTPEVRLEIEEARRRSVEEGCCGVLVERPVTGTGDEWRVHASHPDVPFGIIFERPRTDDPDGRPFPCLVDRPGP